ncbi:hypothetical protein SAMN04488122_5243 [Chitinophaga arvensicola]|uniref:Uncharacterized protein n=1 Tax=Chitinophaga arvensicola TaxID=29529 RepID=A0A1I0S9L2_9BACT|nr:hypothetical protein SAMN04488122_5243 [Chitinophaga arvensicola]
MANIPGHTKNIFLMRSHSDQSFKNTQHINTLNNIKRDICVILKQGLFSFHRQRDLPFNLRCISLL